MKNQSKLQKRKDLIKKRINLDKLNVSKNSASILQKLDNLEAFQESKNVLFYIPIKNEVDTLPIIKKYLEKKNIYLPKSLNSNTISINLMKSFEDLNEGKYGIPEPSDRSEKITAKKLDLIIVPGVGFDIHGFRIGFGKGYYDRLLKMVTCPKIALSYDLQIQDKLPIEPHDEKVDIIITENQIINIK
ncbi:5-formyltetrahydrofolate cyclo-ligase [Patescibacteria group bacterium]